jgi:hypothetical protein
MPISGLALIGFMTEEGALSFLMQRCIPPEPTPEALRKCWDHAKAKLGEPAANAGRPDIRDISLEFDDHLQAVMQMPRFASSFVGMNISFKMVEIAPLLAYQFQVESPRSNSLCGDTTEPSDIRKLLQICLPPVLEDIPRTVAGQQSGLIVKSRSLNMRMMSAGHLGQDATQGMDFAGIGFGPALPLVQVARFDGRCYLRNGFHRAAGLRRAGVTHIPCVFLELTDFNLVGAGGPPNTFARAVLESDNPPTCRHFDLERAYSVSLRQMTRIISVSWNEYVFPDE